MADSRIYEKEESSGCTLIIFVHYTRNTTNLYNK